MTFDSMESIISSMLFCCCCCYCCLSDCCIVFSVDENERKAGHDPEKDLKDSGFQEWAPG